MYLSLCMTVRAGWSQHVVIDLPIIIAFCVKGSRKYRTTVISCSISLDIIMPLPTTLCVCLPCHAIPSSTPQVVLVLTGKLPLLLTPLLLRLFPLRLCLEMFVLWLVTVSSDFEDVIFTLMSTPKSCLPTDKHGYLLDNLSYLKITFLI